MSRREFSNTLAARQVDQACDRFEEAWHTDNQVRIERFLQNADEPMRSQLIRELVLLEIDLRIESGERPGASEYLDRFPKDQQQLREVLATSAIASEATLDSSHQGESPSGKAAVCRQVATSLLFGLIAVRRKILDPNELLTALNDWIKDKSKLLGDLLVEKGYLKLAQRQSLDKSLHKHLAKHDNDPRHALIAIRSLGALHTRLSAIPDDEVQRALSLISDGSSAHEQPQGRVPSQASSSHSRYAILHSHAKGGLGEVFVARDQELNREVALKQIREHAADDEATRARFVLEAEVTGKLEHPGVVPVYGLGQNDRGQPYYAMRFIEGESLQKAIDRFHSTRWAGRGAGARLVRLMQLLNRFVDVCNAIAFAHSRGIVHRDLKPDNVLLGHYGETLVVDWGLAKRIERSEKEDVVFASTHLSVSDSGNAPTRLGAVMGTPAYMSPEQAAGRTNEIGPQSDVYSLGATLYYLLTGRRPFLQDSLQELLPSVQRGQFPPPRLVDRQITPALNAICLKAMATGAKHRYSSASQLGADIEQWLADEPVTALPENSLQRTARWLLRHRTWVRVGTAVLLTSAVAATIAAIRINQSRLQLTDTVREKEELVQEKGRLANTNERLAADAQQALADSEQMRYLSNVALAAQEWTNANLVRSKELLDACPQELRRFEWNYLDRLQRSDLMTLGVPNNNSSVHCVVFSPDGRHLIAGRDSNVMIWDLQAGERPRALQAQSGTINDVAVSQDGQLIASAGRDKSIQLWNLETGELLATLEGIDKAVYSLAFSPDGKVLASASEYGSLQFWHLNENNRPETLQTKGPRLWSIDFSPGRPLSGRQLMGIIGIFGMWQAVVSLKNSTIHRMRSLASHSVLMENTWQQPATKTPSGFGTLITQPILRPNPNPS